MAIIIHYTNFIIIYKYIYITSHPLTQEPKIRATSKLIMWCIPNRVCLAQAF